MRKTKKTPEALRAKARELLRKAEQLENELAIRVGKLVLKYYEQGFDGINIDTLKDEIKKLRGE